MLLLVVSGLGLMLLLVLLVAVALVPRWRRPARRDEVDRFSTARSLTSTWAAQGPASLARPAAPGDETAEG